MNQVNSKDFPDSFRKNVVGAFAHGAAWLDALPGLIDECAQRWRLSLDDPFELSFNYVAPACTSDGRKVVLKIGVPNPDLSSEIRALQFYSGRGAVRLFDFDEHRGFLLLERAVPGHMVSLLEDDEEATRICARVMRELWLPLPAENPFPTVAEWADGLNRLRRQFHGGTGPFPSRLVKMAESLFRDLLASSGPPVLLHGDLHHFNVLSAQRGGWLAIDPKGAAGEPAYDVGALLRNPYPSLFTNTEIQRRRVAVLSEELGLGPDRILAWGIAQAVLSAWWSFEDSGDDWQAALACAETLAGLLKKLA